MNENKLKQIKNQIEDQKWDYWISNNLINFLTKQNIKLSKQELYELTKHLINENAFEFLVPISNIIRDLASTDEDFIKILESMIEKIKNDMAQGPFIDSLTFIGKSNPALAMKIADKLLKSSEPEYSSFLIGNSFHKLPNKCNVFITKLLSSENPRHQVTALKTLRIVYKDREIEDMQKTFDILENASKSDFIEVKSESLEAFLDFYKNDIQKSNRMIENLIRNHTKCKYLLAKRITSHSPFDDKTSLYFLDICSEDSDINVKRTVFKALVKFTKKHADVVLEILAKYTIRYKYDLDGMSYVLKNMGETNAANALAIILDWFKNDRYLKLRRYISIMIKDLVSKTDKKIILKPIFQLIDSEPKFMNKGIDILHEVISDAYKNDSDPEFTSALFDSLVILANKQGIDIALVAKNEDNKILQCADIIDKIRKYSKPLDYDTIYQNLNKFPNIKCLFGDSWFECKKLEKNRTHPILKMLEQQFPTKDEIDELNSSVKNARTVSEKFYHTDQLKTFICTFRFLDKLDRDIMTMRDNGFKTNWYSKNLKNEPQFDATLSEIDFIIPFLNHHNVEPEPKINSKLLDAKIEIGAQTVYVEVISPDMFKPLAKLRGARTVPNRIKGKIYDEFKNQLKVFDSTNQPIIVAIDVGRSEITYNFVEDYLLGPLTGALYFDTEKGESVDSFAYRNKKDSMHGLEPETDLISAVVCYKTRLYDDLSYGMEGIIFENSHAKIPLCPDVKKIIKQTLFTSK